VNFIKILFLFLLIINFLNAGVRSTDKGIEFYYDNPAAGCVAIAGTFNDWNTNSDFLTLNDEGIWTINLKLKQGTYQYKFFVDGNWIEDPDNPMKEGDGYGGFNSVINVDSDGNTGILKQLSERNKAPSGIRTRLNPKILFDGRYYTKSIFVNNDNGRFMLEKPTHDINLGLQMNLNNYVKGYTVLNINNIEEGADMWKTHLNFKRSKLELNADIFKLTVFDNFGLVTSDDPLHIVGDIGRYHYAFGYDQLGVYCISKIPEFVFPLIDLPTKFNLMLIYSDKAGNDDSDMNAIRGKFDLSLNGESILYLGASNYRVQIPVTTNSSQKHISNEIDVGFKHELSSPDWINPMVFIIDGEYYTFENQDIDSVTTKWLDGNRIYVGLKVKFPAALKLYGKFQLNRLNFDESLSKNNFTLGGNFKIEKISANAEIVYWNNKFPDSLVSWNDYFRYMEKTDDNGRWFQEYSDVTLDRYTLLGYDTGLRWRMGVSYNFEIGRQNILLEYKSAISQINFLYDPRYVENEFIIDWKISNHWGMYSNTRIPYHNDSFLELQTDFSSNTDVFIDNFTKISYFLNKNVEISLGWGVNPRVLNSLTDEFYDGGRDAFLQKAGNLENYLENNYKGLGEKLREAEKDLMNEQRIGIEAIVKF